MSSCALFPSLDGLAGDPPDAAGADVLVEAPNDAPAAKLATLVQKKSFAYELAATSSAQLPSPATSGDFIAVVMASNNPDANATFSISDTLGNAWTPTPFHRCTNSDVGARIWFVESSKAGTEKVTLTQSSPPPADAGLGWELGVAIYEYAGIASSQALDVETGVCASSATTAMSSGNVTTSADDLLIGVFADPCGQGTMTAGAGWNPVDVYSIYFYMMEDDRGVNGAGVPPGTYAATGTNPQTSNCWVAVEAAFKLR